VQETPCLSAFLHVEPARSLSEFEKKLIHRCKHVPGEFSGGCVIRDRLINRLNRNVNRFSSTIVVP